MEDTVCVPFEKLETLAQMQVRESYLYDHMVQTGEAYHERLWESFYRFVDELESKKESKRAEYAIKRIDQAFKGQLRGANRHLGDALVFADELIAKQQDILKGYLLSAEALGIDLREDTVRH